MNYSKLRTLIFIVISFAVVGKGFSNNLDSLWQCWKNKKLHDTLRLDANDYLLRHYWQTNIDTALILADEQIKLAEKTGSKFWVPYSLFNKGYTLFAADRFKESVESYEKAYAVFSKNKKAIYGQCLNNMALGYLRLGDYKKSFSYYTIAKEFYREKKDTNNLARTYNQLAMVRDYEGRWLESLDLYFETLRLFEQLKDDYGISVSYINIATIYDQLKDKEQAKNYFIKAITLKRKIGDEYGEAIALANIATYDADDKQFDKALAGLAKVIEIYKRNNATQMLGNAYSSLGAILTDMKRYDEALENYEKAVELTRKAELEPNLAEFLGGLGELYVIIKNHTKAINVCSEGLKLSVKTGFKSAEKRNCDCLYKAYELSGDTKNAFKYFKQYISIKDSLISEENREAATRKNLEFDFARKKLKDSLEYSQKEVLSNAKITEQELQLDKERTLKYALYSGIALLLVLGGVSYKSYRDKKKDNLVIAQQKTEVEKQNIEIESQRHILESKNKEITDSITYAKRIQEAILPAKSVISKYLPDSFILYKPKDIVAGDFFWIENINGITLFAAADCTGHGVPGAMVSVVCHNALNRAVKEFGLTEPGRILDKTRELVIEQFEKSEQDVKDGMDISLCALSFSNQTLQWAGANNPLWIIRKDATEMEEIKADKQPIGKFIEQKPFTTHTINLSSGDTIYIFSDGYQDQFGGKDNKKYKAANFKKLLLESKERSMPDQKQIIDTSFESWRGNQAQVDDVCVIGVKM